MRKINAKTLLDTFTALGTVAVLCMSVGNADANVLSARSLTVPLENLPENVHTNYRIRYEPTQSIVNGTVVVNVSGGTFGFNHVYLYGWKYDEITHKVCQGEPVGSSVTLTNCSLKSGSFYVIDDDGDLHYGYDSPEGLDFKMTNSPLVISVNSIAGSGSATLFTAAQELSFKVSNYSSTGISISVSDAYNYYNHYSWYDGVPHFQLNFILSNLPSSVTRVTCPNKDCIRNNVTPGNNSATVSVGGYVSGIGNGNYTYHFIFNNGLMQTQYIKPIHVIAVATDWKGISRSSHTWFITPTPMTTSVPINQTPNSNKMQTTQNQNTQGNVNNNQNTNSAVNQVYNMINSVLPSILPRILK
ncbi:MAG: hypothetical protein QXJ62_05665 [Nitrososphaeria archaeon]